MPLATHTAAAKDRNTGMVPMQHRHFATIATIIRNMEKVHNQSHGFIDIREDVAEHFADHLALTNDKFDRDRFIAACR